MALNLMTKGVVWALVRCPRPHFGKASVPLAPNSPSKDGRLSTPCAGEGKGEARGDWP